MNNAGAGDTLRPLPIRVRPHRGETVESYIRRVARANHLRPSYLRRFLTGPANQYARVQPDRLAVVTGRTPAALEHALTGLTKAAPPARDPAEPSAGSRTHRPAAAKPELFAAIRHAANQQGLSIRGIEARYRVHRRTIRQALASPIPPPRKQVIRPPRALLGLHQHIDEILDAQPDIPVGRIWERLIDHHDANASYGAIRDYVAGRRQTTRNPDQLH